MDNMMQGQVSELRRVRLWFVKGQNPTEHFMHQSQVDACVKAAIELHFTREVNPFSHNSTSRLWRVEVGQLVTPKAYWHTTPGMGIDKFQQGAEVSFWLDTRVWSHPELNKLEAKYD